jgi:hypothetical protein
MELPFELLLYADSCHFRPPGHPVQCIENFSHLRSDRKLIAQRARMSIVRELTEIRGESHAAWPRLGRSDVAAFEFKNSHLERD